jgi:UDP-glucuronate 4-epimerase
MAPFQASEWGMDCIVTHFAAECCRWQRISEKRVVMKRVLVTGVAGFIGSHVAEQLLRRGDAVVGIDNFNDYYSVVNKERNVASLTGFSSFELVRGDICDRPLLEGVFRTGKITHIAHLAARAGVRPSIEDPFIYEDANVRGTLTLLEAARHCPIVNTVVTSSSSVYGNSTRIPFREDDSATDRPISPYAASKKATEVLSYTYHQLYKMNINVVRPFTVYGPRGRPDMAPWIFLSSALSGKPIKKFGNGETRRDYTFIDDFVAGFLGAIDTRTGYEIFNLGNSSTVSLNEAIATIEAVTGRTLLIDNHPQQPGDVDLTNADVEKAKRMLGYNPATSFRDGMHRFYEWFRAQ